MKKLGFTALLTVILSLAAFAVEVGDAAPLIKASDQNGETWTLSEHLDKGYLVVYFYPGAMTGGCTKQACAYRDHVAAETENFQVVGISGDSVESLKWFQKAENLNFTLLSDSNGAIAKSFGVPVREGEKSIKRTVDGKEVELKRVATTARWTFIIDSAGKVVYRAEKVKPLEDLQGVLGFLSKSK
ncbi:MAG: peroxiredoxin [Kiritimatiellales bacterium]|nr:peroxiredoxin [Pontiella sp.]NNJ71203.1 peroxiredoxin [Kiritimatiellales bacterium]